MSYRRVLRYRTKHRVAGLCIYCPEPAAPGKVRCEFHVLKHRARQQERRREHRETP